MQASAVLRDVFGGRPARPGESLRAARDAHLQDLCPHPAKTANRQDIENFIGEYQAVKILRQRRIKPAHPIEQLRHPFAQVMALAFAQVSADFEYPVPQRQAGKRFEA
jgi:hypothetical protein